MLRVMRDGRADTKRRDDMAKASAPYCHNRGILHSGAIGTYDLSRVTDADLNKLEDILGPIADTSADQSGEGEA